MRAIVHAGTGGPEVLSLRDNVPDPEPGTGAVRVRVRAAGLNRADVLQRRGAYPAPAGWPADIPGLEYAGEVQALGPGAGRWRLGERVMGLVGGGAHAELLVVHQDEVLPVPAHLGWTDAAAIPEAFLTAWDALVARGRLQSGETVLIHAAASGVGTAAIQLAKLAGATVLGTSRSAAKLDQLLALGLEVPIDTSRASFREQIGIPVHLILDVLGGLAFADNLELLAPRGRLVLLGFLQGPSIPAQSLEPILRKRLEVIGTVMRTRPREERVALADAFMRQVFPKFGPPRTPRLSLARPGRAVPDESPEEPALRPVVHAVFPFAEIAAAHGAMERNEPVGKIVLRW
ncbi:MAG: NAD(P)H-quinone oxidoreductase [Gemmatimonadales bacterium]